MRALRLPRLPRRPQPPSNCVETIAPMAQPLLRERRVCADGMPAASLAVGRALSEKWTNGRDARRERNARRCNLMLAASLLSLFSSAFAGAGVLPALPHSQRRNCPIAWNLCFFLANLKHPRFRHSLIQLCAVCFFFFSFFSIRLRSLSLVLVFIQPFRHAPLTITPAVDSRDPTHDDSVARLILQSS